MYSQSTHRFLILSRVEEIVERRRMLVELINVIPDRKAASDTSGNVTRIRLTDYRLWTAPGHLAFLEHPAGLHPSRFTVQHERSESIRYVMVCKEFQEELVEFKR